MFPAYQAGGLATDLPTLNELALATGLEPEPSRLRGERTATRALPANVADATGLEPASSRETTERPAFGLRVRELVAGAGIEPALDLLMRQVPRH